MRRVTVLAAALAAAMVFSPLNVDRASAGVLVTIDKASQLMSVKVDGARRYSWPVSTGLHGGPPTGSYTPQRLERMWHSRKFDWAPMPYSVFFYKGYAIHGTPHVSRLGRRASHGCVRLHPKNAAKLFSLIKREGVGNIRIVVE